MFLNFSYIAVVFGAGALSFLSPCVLPLVPPYLCYMAGIEIEDFKNHSYKASSALSKSLFYSALNFVLGFSTIFICLGLGASSVGLFLRKWQSILAIASGLLIISMGLNFLEIIKISVFFREARFQQKSVPTNVFGSYLMGAAFAFGWTPCIGPILSPILGMALSQKQMWRGAFLLGVYSLGLGIPFILAAFFSGTFMKLLSYFRVHLNKVKKIIGILLIVAGVLFLTGGMNYFSSWLLEKMSIFNQ